MLGWRRDVRDIETSEAIESLRGDIRRVEVTLSSEIGKLRTEMLTREDLASGLTSVRSEMGAMRDELRSEMSTRKDLASGLTSVRDELRAEMGAMREELRADMRAMRDELRHYMDIRFESVRDDIRILAEGYASLAAGQAAISAKLDRLLPPPA